jgi:HD-like signal output (HDOD) protein
VSESQGSKPNVSKEIIERLKALDDLPHFPEALMKLERLLAGGGDVHIDDIVQLIAMDPRLVAGLIGVVNTAKYYMGREITELEEAVTRIGTQEVRMMAHAINYKTTFKRKPPFSEKHFLKNSLLAAFVAQTLAKAVHVNSGEAFLGGLMRDLGIYLLAVEDRDKYIAVMRETDYNIALLPAAETRAYGTNHAMMSARLLQQWKFPQGVIMGVANHHSPERADERFKAFAYVIYMAEDGAFRLGVENGVADLSDEDREQLPEGVLNALDYFGMTSDTYEELLQKAYQTAEQAGMI